MTLAPNSNPFDVQYYYTNRSTFHDYSREPDTTVCVVVPDKQDLENIMLPFSEKTIKIALGKAYKHPDDQFVKKEGRNLAFSRVKEVEFYLRRVSYDRRSKPEEATVFLTLFSEDEVHTLLLSIRKNRKHPRLESASV